MSENHEWNVTVLKEYFDAILKERDDSLKASFIASQNAIDKAETRLNEILEGFPQDYGRKSDIENLEKEINAVKADHVQRREFDTLKDVQSQGRGARLALSATAGVIIALISITLGVMYSNQLTHQEVSNQISREAPWLADRPQIDNELSQQEKEIDALRAELVAHEAADKIREAAKK